MLELKSGRQQETQYTASRPQPNATGVRQSTMQVSSWLLVAVAALAATSSNARTTSQCPSIKTCFEGGAQATPCTIANGACPPCMTFADKGCYVKVGGACPFGIDCTTAWSDSTASSSSGSSSPPTNQSISKTPSATSTEGSTPAGTSSNAAASTTPSESNNSTKSDASDNKDTIQGASKNDGSDMSVVFAIIGAAIGVIAVAVIFLTLVRRSKAASEDEDDMISTPPAFSKHAAVPSQQNNIATPKYTNYGGSNLPSGNGAEAAVNYYNQQPPQNSTAPSPRVAGRAIPSLPVGMNQNAAAQRPYGSQNYSVPGATQQLQRVPSGDVKTSPIGRKESFEF